MGRRARQDRRSNKGRQVILMIDGIGSLVLTPLVACAVDVTCHCVAPPHVDVNHNKQCVGCVPSWMGNHAETTQTELCESSCCHEYATGLDFCFSILVCQSGMQSCESLMKSYSPCIILKKTRLVCIINDMWGELRRSTIDSHANGCISFRTQTVLFE